MEEALIKCLKTLIETIMVADLTEVTGEQIVDCFLQRAKLALSPEGRLELIEYINSFIF